MKSQGQQTVTLAAYAILISTASCPASNLSQLTIRDCTGPVPDATVRVGEHILQADRSGKAHIQLARGEEPEVWAWSTETGHIYKSTDGGETWARTDNNLKDFTGAPMTLGAGYCIRGITVEPGNSQVVYAQGHVSGHRFKTRTRQP